MAIKHKQSEGWRIIRIGRYWQVQQWTKSEALGDSWWNIGRLQECERDAMAIMYSRCPMQETAS